LIWNLFFEECETERNQNYTFPYLKMQRKIDPERMIHSPNLYALWNLKSYIMQTIAEQNPFSSSFFIYTDAGAWRDFHRLNVTSWPDVAFINTSLAPALKDRILFGQISSILFFLKKFRAHIDNIIQGTFFAGSSKAVANFYTKFFELRCMT
jgi:hypothetical protein